MSLPQPCPGPWPLPAARTWPYSHSRPGRTGPHPLLLSQNGDARRRPGDYCGRSPRGSPAQRNHTCGSCGKTNVITHVFRLVRRFNSVLLNRACFSKPQPPCAELAGGARWALHGHAGGGTLTARAGPARCQRALRTVTRWEV